MPQENDDLVGFYTDRWPAGAAARLAALPAGGAALDGEIDTLRVLLRSVLAEKNLGTVERLIAFGRGADYLGRCYRVQAFVAQHAGAADKLTLDAVLASMGLGPPEEEGASGWATPGSC